MDTTTIGEEAEAEAQEMPFDGGGRQYFAEMDSLAGAGLGIERGVIDTGYEDDGETGDDDGGMLAYDSAELAESEDDLDLMDADNITPVDDTTLEAGATVENTPGTGDEALPDAGESAT